MNPVRVNRRFSLPFYPMRPRTGSAIRQVDDLTSLHPGYAWFLKLNGDRVCLASLNGEVMAINRHGSRYKFRIENQGAFESLRGTWLFDGEVFSKRFYPFEALVSPSNDDLALECPSVRSNVARGVCTQLGIDWVFGSDIQSEATMAFIEDRLGIRIEGVVGKKLKSPYVQIGSASQVSSAWVKRKWTR